MKCARQLDGWDFQGEIALVHLERLPSEVFSVQKEAGGIKEAQLWQKLWQATLKDHRRRNLQPVTPKQPPMKLLFTSGSHFIHACYRATSSFYPRELIVVPWSCDLAAQSARGSGKKSVPVSHIVGQNHNAYASWHRRSMWNSGVGDKHVCCHNGCFIGTGWQKAQRTALKVLFGGKDVSALLLSSVGKNYV